MVLWQLKGVPYDKCDALAKAYFEEELLPNIVPPLVELLKKHIDAKDRVCILSGGYDIYIKYFAQYFGVKEIICSKIAFENDICSGKMEGLDCMRENKLSYIKPLMVGASIICYTDSQSDLPLLKLVNEPIVVSRIIPQQWATQQNFKQIIWN